MTRGARYVGLAVVVVLAAALAVVAVSPTPSRATGHERCFTDPDGDARTLEREPAAAPRADVAEVCGVYEAMQLTFSLRVAEPVDPDTDPAWQAGEALALWAIQDAALAYGPPSGQVLLDVVDGDLRVVATWYDDATPVCAGTGSFDGTWYIAEFDPGCLEVPDTVSFAGYAEYDGAFDAAPEGMGREGDGRYGGPLTRANVVAPSFDRLAGRFAGPTRIDTAVEVSRSQFPHGAEEVYLARQDDFPDALAAGSLTRGPILLVPSCGTLPQVVAFEIDRLDPVRVIALGGTAAVCDDLLRQARDR